MLKQFPIRLAIKILIAVLFFCAGGNYIVFPLYRESRKMVMAIRYHYSGAGEAIQLRLEKERALLAEFERTIASPPDSGKNKSGYYDFIRETLRKKDVQTIKITSREQTMRNNVRQENFEVVFTGTYHTVGMIIGDLENGPFNCSVKTLHLLSKSLLDNTLEAALVVSFRRAAG